MQTSFYVQVKTSEPKDKKDKIREFADKTVAHDELRQTEHATLVRAQVGDSLARLFFELTGLRLFVAWAPPPNLAWDSALPLGRTAVCRRIRAGGEANARCARFEGECLTRTLQSGPEGYAFTCSRGVHNFWLPIVLEAACLGIVFIQFASTSARDHHPTIRGPVLMPKR